MRLAMIVGTGMRFLIPEGKWETIVTPYGPAYIGRKVLGGHEVVLVRRHGPGLNVPPHLINYHANFSALRDAGIDRVIATAAVGTMRKDLTPGSLAVVGDFIDFTKRRLTTIYDQPSERLEHTDFSVPYCPELSAAIEKAGAELGIPLAERVVYVCVDGPRYETPAEIRMFAQWGGDVVGMTGVPEVVLARELGICYGSLAICTNYAAGISAQPLSHEEVVACVAERRQQIHDLLEGTVALLPEEGTCCERR